jgi:hypothetical protein
MFFRRILSASWYSVLLPTTSPYPSIESPVRSLEQSWEFWLLRVVVYLIHLSKPDF